MRTDIKFYKDRRLARENLNKKTAQILFRKYLISFFDKTLSFDLDKYTQAEVSKNIKSLQKEIVKLNKEYEELIPLAEAKPYDEAEKKQKSSLPEELIEKAREKTNKLKDLFAVEKETEGKQAFLDEINKFIKIFEKKKLSAESENFVSILELIIMNLLREKTLREEELTKLEAEIKTLDEISHQMLREIMDMVDNYKKGREW